MRVYTITYQPQYRHTVAIVYIRIVSCSIFLDLTAAVAAIVFLTDYRMFTNRTTLNQFGRFTAGPDQQHHQNHDDRNSSRRQIRTLEAICPSDQAILLEPVHNEPGIAQQEDATNKTDNDNLSDP